MPKLKSHSLRCNSYPSSSPAFTIVELLVVIVVIGILAAITIVAYTGITGRAVISSLQSDLANANNQLRLYYVDNGVYPTANQCPAPSVGNICLKPSSGNSFTYQPNAVDYLSYNLYGSNINGTNYRITDNNQTALATSLICPLNFIIVPGSSTYGTSSFCVMKYEAKQVGFNVPISQATGLPWIYITQTSAIANAPNVAGCTGCHLITEAEWLTIAQNVLSVPSNWSGGSVGSGYIYRGHNDDAPSNALAADTNDGNGYTGESNTGGNQRRTLTLTNGEVIWDLAGNVHEWTQGTIAGGQQPGFSGEVAYTYKDWNNASLIRNGLPVSAMPVYAGLSGASGWTAVTGIGQLLSNYSETALKAFFRGGCWGTCGSIAWGNSGVLRLDLNAQPSASDIAIGFRVSR